MTEEIKKAVGYFADGNGDQSSIRLVSIVGSLSIIFVWSIVSLVDMKLAPFSTELVGLIGVLLGAKVGQKYFEAK